MITAYYEYEESLFSEIENLRSETMKNLLENINFIETIKLIHF